MNIDVNAFSKAAYESSPYACLHRSECSFAERARISNAMKDVIASNLRAVCNKTYSIKAQHKAVCEALKYILALAHINTVDLNEEMHIEVEL